MLDRRMIIIGLVMAAVGIISPWNFGFAGEVITLTGRVLSEKGEPLSGVLVTLVNPPYGQGVTNLQGEFTLVVSEPLTSWELIAASSDYPPVYLSIPVTQREITIQLSSSPPASERQIATVPVTIEADKFYYEEATDVYRVTGKVEITYRGDRMTAEIVELRKKTDRFIAEGQVFLKSAEGDVMEGRRLEMSLSDKTGYLERGEIFVHRTHVYLRGPRLERTGEATYHGERVELTTCDGENPDWRITAESLAVTVDGYGTLKSGCFYAKGVPVVYAPYLIFPVKTTRQTGFLLPHRMAYSRDRLGLDLGIPFFWAISADKDATFYQRFMSQRGFQEGVEFRYAALKSHGTLYGEVLQDRKKIKETVGDISRNWNEEKTRWALYLNQETYFREDLFLRADIARVSDSFYFKDFTSYNYFQANFKPDREGKFQKIDFLGNESLPYLESSVRLTKSWNQYNLTLLAKNTQDLTVLSDRQTLQKYPEVAFMGVKQPLGKTPLWFDVSGIYDYFYRREGEKGHLLDVTPTVYLPLSFRRYLGFTPFVGLRALMWARDDKQGGQARTDHREIYLAGATFATELSRSYSLGEKAGHSIRHTLQPEIVYLYSPAPSGGQAPNFVPTVSAGSVVNNVFDKTFVYQAPLGSLTPLNGDFNLVSYSLSNFLSLRDRRDGKVKQFDFLRWKLTQYYDIREERRPHGRPWSDVFSELDVNPIKCASLSTRHRYDVYNTRWREENYTLSFKDERGDTASLSYRFTRDSVKEVNMNLKAVVDKSLDLRLNFRRDLINDRNLEKGMGIDYRRQCWSVGVDFGESMNDRVFSVRFSLLGL